MKTKYNFLTKEFLYTEHWIKKKTLVQIAKENNIPEGSIGYLMKMFKVPIRSQIETNKMLFNKWSKILTEEFLRREYLQNKKTMKEIAKEVGCGKVTVFEYLKKYNIPTRTYGSWEVWNKGLTKEKDPRVAQSGKKGAETRRKKYKKGEIQVWNKGLTKETDGRMAKLCKKLSKIRKIIFKGEGNPFYGKRHSLETRKRLSLAHGGIGIPRLFRDYPEEFNDKLKEKIRKRDNYQCQLCGITEEEYIIVFGERLTVHHIDYNKNNNNEDNLISLCRSCHARTNVNRITGKSILK